MDHKLNILCKLVCMSLECPFEFVRTLVKWSLGAKVYITGRQRQELYMHTLIEYVAYPHVLSGIMQCSCKLVNGIHTSL